MSTKKYDAAERTSSWGKRVSDGLLPPAMVKFLWQPLIPGTTINGYSVMHFLSGCIVGALGLKSWLAALLIHTAWEVFQFGVGDNQWSKEDLLFDIPLDTAFFMLGWYAVRKLRNKQTRTRLTNKN